jgi:hypothetical protein
MAAREGTRSLLGSASAWVEIQDAAARPLTLSSIFLLADGGAGGTDLTDVQAVRRFRSGQGLHYVVHVYASPAGSAAVTLQAQVWLGPELVGVTPKHALVANPGETTTRWSERISLEGFAPGAYELRVLAAAGNAETEQQVSFSVE